MSYSSSNVRERSTSKSNSGSRSQTHGQLHTHTHQIGLVTKISTEVSQNKPVPISYMSVATNHAFPTYPNIEEINKTTSLFVEYEQTLTPQERRQFLRRKRYQDMSIVPGSEVCLNDGTLIEGSVITPDVFACSAPIISEQGRFWRCVLERDISLIVSLTPWVENGVLKADIYYSPMASTVKKFDKITVMTNSDITTEVSTECKIDLRQSNIKIMQLVVSDTENNITKTVHHLHYTGWADRSVPSTNDMFSLMIVYSKLAGFNNPVHKKTLVHCSAGLGRTGVFLTLCTAITQINEDFARDNLDGSIDVRQIVVDLRRRRLGLVQTQEQMNFVVECICVYIKWVLSGKTLKLIPMKVPLTPVKTGGNS
ncbi:receptor-type tyrosine-protein phosphatase eta isoform X1 [Yasminevirus sp. GU-2018]|uniref:Receptor-type tyrosine-protein phosphatase eta isoform X1 n=1 Tax=Yasminevirus sp. GU-2018 TaxID=2420051 RepID=A0A5K0U8C1_9VIRU|nr:receptor-type tyrosine-protein phosphatase eta isoform X1 [Yasminevirus sp. GU-2018]